MADPARHNPASAHHHAPHRAPLSLYEQSFALLVGSNHFWTPNAEDRAMVRDILREELALPELRETRNPYMRPLVDLTGAMLDPATPRARWGGLGTELSRKVHDFLRWRGLLAYAAARDAAQARADAAGSQTARADFGRADFGRADFGGVA